MFGQGIPASQPAFATRTDSRNADIKQIEPLLARYRAAHEHRDLGEVLAIWPSLQNDQKELKKIKKQFERADILSTKVALESSEVQFPSKDEAIVKSTCTQQYVQLVSSSYASGDLNLQAMPAQNPGPTNNSDKKSVKKTNDIWMTLHRDGDSWTIVSVSDKKPH